MAKANLKLPNGTVVTLEGTPEEVKHLLELYGGGGQPASKPASRGGGAKRSKARGRTAKSIEDKQDGKPDLSEIVTLVKDCEEAEAIETQILDRTAQVDRTLLEVLAE